MKRLFANTLITSVDYAVLVALNLAATPFLIQHFGMDGYGAFVFLSIFSIYGALAVFDLGMEGALMNYIARFQAADQQGKMQSALAVSLVYYAAIGALLGLAIHVGTNLLASRLLDSSATLEATVLHQAVSLVAVNIFFQFLTVPLTATLQGMRRYAVSKGINSASNVLRYVLVVAVAIWFGRIDAGFVVVLALTVLRLAALAYALFAQTPEFRHMRWRLEGSLFRTLFSYSSILFVTRVIGLVHNQTPKVLIWYYLSATSMTVYDVAARPATLLRLVMSMLVSAIIPESARLSEQGDKETLRKLYVNMVRYSYLVILPLLAVLFAHMGGLLRAWVGDQFRAYSELALILLTGYLILPISAVANTMVVGLQKVRETIWIPITGTAINLVVSIVSLQYIGLAGLMLGTVASQLFTFVPYAHAMGRFVGFSVKELYRPLLKPVLVALVSLVVNVSAQRWLMGLTTLIGIIAAVSLAINLALNYRFMLQPNEQAFLVERVRSFWSRVSPGQGPGTD